MNNMDDKQILETMHILQEECAEVVQAASKIFRFGFDEVWPENAPTNRQKFEEEIGDLLAMVDILIENCVISDNNVNAARQNKKTKLLKWSNVYGTAATDKIA
jgi:NTP pyrophosphatase (non-canonical NTP hydrolase)